MSDLVERLRDYETVGITALPRLCGEAAARIEALEAALRKVAEAGPMLSQSLTRKELVEIARDALGKDA